MRHLTIWASFGALALCANPMGAAAQEWPDGPIELVIPSRPGGGTDIMGRIVADYLQQSLDVPVVVINQPGGGGTVAFEQVRNADPDGQMLLFHHTGLLVNAHTGKYDHGLGDFTTVAIAQSYPPQVFAVGADAPWNTLRAFVDDARARPGELTVGVALGGSSHFIAGELMANEQIELRLVEAAAEVDKVAGVQGGHISIGNLGAGSARQFEQAGQMRGLCMLDPEGDPDYPEYRACASQGVDIEWLSPLVIWGPAGMDPAITEEINTAIAGMAGDTKVQERLEATDSTFRALSVAEAGALIAHEDAKIAELAESLQLGQ
ncbi:MAG: tripartite tricarboxylate transporter substrate binding protein [Paracoccus sp. (in: a-proteobacteria)]|uniref:Bug family tripartite tricarboxylate transporter substrate binding protein n=1 Tax=Paracoccus sp. TaxID=267 RepID=UPI00324289BE